MFRALLSRACLPAYRFHKGKEGRDGALPEPHHTIVPFFLMYYDAFILTIV